MTPSPRRWSDSLAKWRGMIERRLEWLPALCGVAAFIVALLESPTIKSCDTQRLAGFYEAVAPSLFAVLLGVAFFQSASRFSGYPVRRFFGKVTLAVLLAGIGASVVALTDTLPTSGYRWVFAVAASAAVVVVIALVLTGLEMQKASKR